MSLPSTRNLDPRAAVPLRSLPLLGGLLLVAASLGGCIPSTHVDASPVAGVVLNRATHQPVAGATVVLGVSHPDREAQTPTDQDGRFHLAGFRHVVWTPLPYGMFISPSGYLRIEATGYKPFTDGEWPDRDSRGYFDFHGGNGVGSEQHVRVLLAPVGSAHPSSDGNERH